MVVVLLQLKEFLEAGILGLPPDLLPRLVIVHALSKRAVSC